jgi:opacity protein-like surface antigen
MKYTFIVVIIFATFHSIDTNAQGNDFTLKLNYSLGIPTGAFKRDLINNTSFTGFGAELMYHIDPQVGVGIETGSQVFYQKYPRQIYYTTDGSDISAVRSETVQTVPILLKGQYGFMPDKGIQPYVGLGLGGNIISYNQYAGSFSSDQKQQFGFAARPEAGIYIPFTRTGSAGFSIGAAYNIMPFNYNGIANLNAFTAKAGIQFALH